MSKRDETTWNQSSLEQLRDPNTVATIGAAVGLVVGVISMLVDGMERATAMNALILPVFGGLIAWLGIRGHHNIPNNLKFLAGGAVLGLLFGGLVTNFWILSALMVTIAAPLGLLRGYGELQVVKYGNDDPRERSLPLTSSIYLFLACIGLARWFAISDVSLELMGSLLAIPAVGLVTFFIMDSIFEGKYTKEDLMRYEQKATKQEQAKRHSSVIPSSIWNK
jgi:hypothetical protein